MEALRDKKGLTEEEFLKTYNADKYPKPSLTADTVLLAADGEDIWTLLIKRGGHPFIGQWAFPGGFANKGESVEQTAARELEEETGLTGLAMTPVGLFSKPGRDPRGWVVTHAYLATPKKADCKPIAADDAAEAAWFKVTAADGHMTLQNEHTTMAFTYTMKAGQMACDVSWESETKMAFDHSDELVHAWTLLNHQ